MEREIRTQRIVEAEHTDPNMVEIQANIDDMNPELWPPIFEHLLQAGAKDVWLVPITMKQGRPGVTLHVLCPHPVQDAAETVIFKHTTTLGLRYASTTVHRLEKRMMTVDTSFGPIDVKLGFFQGELTQMSPEISQCHQRALEQGKSGKEAFQEALFAAQKLLEP